MKVNTPNSSINDSSNDSVESYAEISFVESVSEDGELEQQLVELKRQHAADIALLKEEMVSHKEQTKNHTKSLLRALLCLENEENLQVKTGQEILDALKCLVEEAENFGIPELYTKARILATNAVKAKPSHSVACLKAYEILPDILAAALLAATDGENLALVAIRKDPKLLLSDESLVLLSSRMLENILKDEKLQTDEYALFEIVQSWSKVNEIRFPEALELMKYIKLEFMSRQELLEVENSPLVSTDRLLSAYKAQALMAEKKTGFSCKKDRHHSLANSRNWKGLNSDVMVGTGNIHKTHVLDCDLLQSGNVYKWSIKFVEGSDRYVYFGVIANKESLNCATYFGGQTGGWSLRGNEGSKWHGGSGVCTKILSFGQGSKVTFVLDLTGDGTLSASTNGGKAEQLFSGMLAKASSLGASGFLPAASVNWSGSKVQFLGFE